MKRLIVILGITMISVIIFTSGGVRKPQANDNSLNRHKQSHILGSTLRELLPSAAIIPAIARNSQTEAINILLNLTENSFTKKNIGWMKDNNPFVATRFVLPHSIGHLHDAIRINEGNSGTTPSFPLAVALKYTRSRILCSGVIISEYKVLTAAHCLCDERPVYAFVGRSVYPTKEDPGMQTYLNLRLDKPDFFNPDFCRIYADQPIEAMRSGDLALLTMEGFLPEDIAEAILPPDPISHTDNQYQTFYAVGWGESDNFWRPGRKNFTQLKLTSRLCSLEDDHNLGCREGIEAVASNPPHDTCFADSGGPLYAIETTGNMYLIAITSRALKNTKNNMCGDGGVYTSLESPPIRSWIDQKLSAKP
jgi:hypothetical protein